MCAVDFRREIILTSLHMDVGWAYADMLMVGVFANPHAPDAGPAASIEEWRSHFGAWCINSSPLILSCDLTNSTTVDSIWPFIANPVAIEINQAWNGHPGRRLSSNDFKNSLNTSPAGNANGEPSAWQAWAKPLPGRRVAVLVVSMARLGSASSPGPTLNLSQIAPTLQCEKAECSIADVWLYGSKVGVTNNGTHNVGTIAPHDSKFLIISAMDADVA